MRSKSKKALLNQRKDQQIIKLSNRFLSLSEKSIRYINETFELFHKLKLTIYDNLLNICLFSTIVHTDLNILLGKTVLTKRKYEKILFCRVLALTIIEYIDDINLLLGRDLLKDLETNGLIKYKEDFKKLSKRFSTIKKSNEPLLRQIRNNTIAHKSKNAITLTNYIYKLDTNNLIKLSFEIIKISADLIKLSNEAVNGIFEAIKVLDE